MAKRCSKKVKPIPSDKKREDVKFTAMEDKAIEMEKVCIYISIYLSIYLHEERKEERKKERIIAFASNVITLIVMICVDDGPDEGCGPRRHVHVRQRRYGVHGGHGWHGR